MQPAITHENIRGGKELIAAGLSVKNIGQTDASLQYLALNVWGLKFGASPKPLTIAKGTGDLVLHTAGLPIASRRLILNFTQIGHALGGRYDSIYAPGRSKPNRRAIRMDRCGLHS